MPIARGVNASRIHQTAGLILDDFAMREHIAMGADDLYELISDPTTG
jgi:hypothetical protein